MDCVRPEEIINFFSQKKTYDEISKILQLRYPGERGFSVKSVKRFCKNHGISPRISQNHIEQIVANAVDEVCITSDFLFHVCNHNIIPVLGMFQSHLHYSRHPVIRTSKGS